MYLVGFFRSLIPADVNLVMEQRHLVSLVVTVVRTLEKLTEKKAGLYLKLTISNRYHNRRVDCATKYCCYSSAYQYTVQNPCMTGTLDPVVQKQINANPRLKINQGVYFSSPKCCSMLILKFLH